jgi:hypothetical protein
VSVVKNVTPVTRPAPGSDPRRSYVRVIIVWIAVLAALYAFQEYFS